MFIVNKIYKEIELEKQIENLNTQMLRDIIILQDETATEIEKEEAKQYLNKKITQKKELIKKINKNRCIR